MRDKTAVHLVLAHRADAQLRHLVRRLLLSDSAVIVHLDSRVPLPADVPSDPRLVFTERRYATAWGSFEMVLAALSLMDEAVQRFPGARYLSLISGQDYPIKSPEQLDAFYQSADRDFLQAWPLAEERWRYGGIRRVNRYYWARNRKSLAGFLWRTIPLPPRRFPLPMDRLYYGSQWWSMRRASAERVLAFVRERPDVLEAFRYTYVPDEMFFVTVLVGYLREPAVAYDNLRHIEHFSLPRDYLRLKILNRNGIRILGLRDLDTLRASPALFARKFDFRQEPALLDQLEVLCSEPAHQGSC